LLPKHAHRCHLAEFWLDYSGLPASFKAQTLISKGVRHSLGLLFDIWAKAGINVLIPKDVYPVYGSIARAANLHHSEYPSMPTSAWPDLTTVDVILVTNPAKPRGTSLDAREFSTITEWLKDGGHRRVVIDAVYNLDSKLDSATLQLMETGQAVVLHSLSKSWLRPQVFGVALIPASDIELLTPLFRAANVNPGDLCLAQALLTQDRQFPLKLLKELGGLQRKLEHRLFSKGYVPPLTSSSATYLFVVNEPAEKLLSRHRVLALPLSVFGSCEGGLSVVSSLPSVPILGQVN